MPTDKEMFSVEDRFELVRLYAQCLLDEVKATGEFKEMCRRLSGNQYFGIELDRTQRAKARVEEWLEHPTLTKQEAVRQAIKLLRRTRAEAELRDRCYELIVSGYCPQWSEPQREAFEAAWQKIQLKNDYFLSFTTRRASDIGDNPVNTTYKHFIALAMGGIDIYKKRDRSKENLLAVATHKQLAEKGLRGFFFVHSQYDNSVVEKKLEEECDNSLVLVQLVQPIMFDLPKGRKNYCFFEWMRFASRFNEEEYNRNILYIVATSDQQSLDNFFADYKKWRDHIIVKDPPYLPEVPFADKTKVMEITQLIEKKLRGQIDRAWLQLEESVPGDYDG
jgi:hypothetical protein